MVISGTITPPPSNPPTKPPNVKIKYHNAKKQKRKERQLEMYFKKNSNLIVK